MENDTTIWFLYVALIHHFLRQLLLVIAVALLPKCNLFDLVVRVLVFLYATGAPSPQTSPSGERRLRSDPLWLGFRIFFCLFCILFAGCSS